MNNSPTFSDELHRYAILLWRWAWLLVLAAILAAGTAYIISRRTVPVYQASTLALVNEAPNNKAVDYTAILTSERLAKTYAQLITTQPVLEGVIQRLGLPFTPGDLAGMVEVQPVRDTQLIKVSVEDIYPERAAGIANALIAEFGEQNQAEQASRYAASKQSFEAQLAQLNQQIEGTNTALGKLADTELAERDRLETTLAQYRQTYAGLLSSYEQVRMAETQTTSSVVQKEPATPPEAPIRPRTMANTALAGVVGLMLAVGVAFLVEAMDDSIKDLDELSRQLDLPILGIIAKHDQEKGELVTKAQPRAPVSEAFRSLRTNLQFSSVDRPLRSLLVTSPSPADGKSTIAANLAVVLAQSGRKVILLDADLRRPRLHRIVGLNNREGISSLFTQTSPNGGIYFNGHIRETGVQNLHALTSGNLPPNPAELLGSEKMADILCEVEGQADIVILDSPPVLVVTDSTVLAPRVDGVLLVVKPGTTNLAACRQSVEQLRRVGANLLGVVLNDVEIKRSRYNYYHYKGYYYLYSEEYGYTVASGKQKSKQSKKKQDTPVA